MRRLVGSSLLSLALLALAASCAGDDELAPVDPSAPASDVSAASLCDVACQRKLESDCTASLASCTTGCASALAGGVCVDELRAHLGCVVAAAHVPCGGGQSGESGECDSELAELEGCISHAADDGGSDCYGKACSSLCGLIGQQVCVPGAVAACPCPAGGEGTKSCSSDGCFWLPCASCRPASSLNQGTSTTSKTRRTMSSAVTSSASAS